MLISLDLPEDLVNRIDDKICKKPAWPFKAREVVVERLNPVDQKKLEDYQKALERYHTSKNNGLRSRSGLITQILKDTLQSAVK